MCRAKVNGEVPKHEKFTVSEIKTDEVANKKISEFQTEKLRFLGDKECRSSEKLHVDSLCRAKANGDVRVHEKSTVSAPETGKVPNPKISELQAVINTVDYYDIDMKNWHINRHLIQILGNFYTTPGLVYSSGKSHSVIHTSTSMSKTVPLDRLFRSIFEGRYLTSLKISVRRNFSEEKF